VNPPRIEVLSDSFVKSQTIAADLYFDFAAPIEDQLPEWSSSKFEFVYIARKLLESPKISSILHDWIDQVFGHRLSDDQLKLFPKSHPSRPPVSRLPSFECDIKLRPSIKKQEFSRL
jgi:hypothetical protein